MSVTRIQVLVWRDFEGLFTASVVEQPEIAAVGATAQECLLQLRHFLTWTQRNQPWMFPETDLEDPQLVRVQVDVRPEYVTGRQRHPSAPIHLSVPCVHGKVASELHACSVPPMRLWFSYH
ncbi:MAG: hypothetical protein KDB82_14660, partial [Planctomycetes bacterium]|nr:hypothetical protein [Planctomycetota bacterium]